MDSFVMTEEQIHEWVNRMQINKRKPFLHDKDFQIKAWQIHQNYCMFERKAGVLKITPVFLCGRQT